jgi:hypothetical protein
MIATVPRGGRKIKAGATRGALDPPSAAGTGKRTGLGQEKSFCSNGLTALSRCPTPIHTEKWDSRVERSGNDLRLPDA